MKPEKVKAVLEFYDKHLANGGYESRQFTEPEYDVYAPGGYALFSHCRWMAQTAAGWIPGPREAVPAKDVEKAMRWLGYIQGVLHALGEFTCNDLRDHSRGGEGEFLTPAQEHGS